MTTNQKRYLWCERTEAEYIKIRAEIEKRRVEMLALEHHEKFDWPDRHQELVDWLERGREHIDKYALGINESWESVCDCAQQGWNELKSEVRGILDESKL